MNREKSLAQVPKISDPRVMNQKLKWMIGIGLPAAGLAYYYGYSQFAYGVLAGLPVAVLNHWLLFSSMIKAQNKNDPSIAAAMYGRSLARLVISLAALTLSMLLGVEFTLGVAAALLTNMLIFIGDAWLAIKYIVRPR